MKNINPFDWHKELKITEFDSLDDDFILLENPIITSTFDYPFKVDVTTVIICQKGSMHGCVNLIHYHTIAPCMFIVLPDQILQYENFSKDFMGLFIVMSNKFVSNLLINIQERLSLLLSVQNNPWIPLRPEELETLQGYYKMLQNTIRLQDNPHRMEIIKHLVQAFFYASSSQYHKIPDNKTKSKQEVLVGKFLNLAQSNYKDHRNLDFYAEKLCLTTKYLSKVVKNTSGTTANEWIENLVVLEAKALLKSTNMTIQQISDELNFPSQSFFGKYFKRNVGVSPKNYRSR